MSSHDRRAAARRRAWGRGPIILRFEPLEGRQLLSADALPAMENPVPAEVPVPAVIPVKTDTSPADATPAPGDAAVRNDASVPNEAPATVANAAADAASIPPPTSAAPDPETTDATPILTLTGADPDSGSADPAVVTMLETAAPPVATVPTPRPTASAMPELVAERFDTLHNLDWGDTFRAVGSIHNRGAATTGAFRVDVVASRSPTLGSGEVRLGSIDFPNGLAADETRTFDQPMALPATPIPAADDLPYVYIRLRVDAANSIDEADEANNLGRGQGLDTSVVTIVPHLPARLVGAAFNISPGPLSWGDTVVVTAQIRNDALGNAPATRARIVLTPVGRLPGGSHDVTIGSLPVPALPSYQSVSVTQTIVLPATQPSTLAGASQFFIWILMDADFQISPLVARPAPQGLGLDAAAITIAPARTRSNRPDLTATDVRVSTDALTWGDSFQVTATLRNGGRADSGPLRVRFLLADPDGATGSAIALGDATVPGLKAGVTQGITQALQLPDRLPEGLMPSGPVAGRIVVQVDPENTIDEANEANNAAPSAPVVLRLLNVDGSRTVVTPAGSTSATPAGSTPATPAGATPATPSGSTPATPAGATPDPAATPPTTSTPPLAPTPEATPSSGSVPASPAAAAASSEGRPVRRLRSRRPKPMVPRPKSRRHHLRLFPGGMPGPTGDAHRRRP